MRHATTYNVRAEGAREEVDDGIKSDWCHCRYRCCYCSYIVITNKMILSFVTRSNVNGLRSFHFRTVLRLAVNAQSKASVLTTPIHSQISLLPFERCKALSNSMLYTHSQCALVFHISTRILSAAIVFAFVFVALASICMDVCVYVYVSVSIY